MRFTSPENWEWNRGNCTSNFAKWTDGQPDEYCGSEDCAAAGDGEHGDWGGGWHDMSCTQPAFCACEYGTSELSDNFSDWDPEDNATDYEGCEEGWLIFIILHIIGQIIGLAAFIGFIFSIIGIATACNLSEQGNEGCCACCPPGTQYCVAIAFLIVDVIMLLFCLLAMTWDLSGSGIAAACYFVYACTATAAVVTLKKKKQFWNVTQQPNQPQAGIAMGTVVQPPVEASGHVAVVTAMTQPAQGGVAMGTVLSGPIDAK